MSDTSDIDNKKNQENNNKTLNVGKFFITFLILLFIFIFYFSLGGATLFFSKLAQSNILPTEIKCFPYTDFKPKITEINTNIFTTFSSPPLSMKLSFPYDDYNSTNSLLDLFREMKYAPDSSIITNYFISIIETMIQGNYSFLNITFHSLNTLPEILILLFGPIITFFITFILFLWNHIYLIYLWFSNMKWFFLKNTQTLTEGKPKWELISPLNVGQSIIAIGLVILFFILFWFLLFGLPLLPFISIMICILTMSTYKGKMNDGKVYLGTIIKDVFKYYKSLIMSIFSFFLIVSAFTHLGNIFGLIAIIVFAIFYFGLVSTDLYKNDIRNGLSALSSTKQAIKTCFWHDPFEKKHGLLYYLFSGGGTEKELMYSLKKLH